MKVLHYIPGFLYGGIESMYLSWYRSIDQREIQFELLIRTQDDCAPALEQYRELGGKYYRLAPMSVKRMWIFKKSVEDFFCMHHDYDILHAHESDPFIFKIAKKYGIPTIILHSHTTTYGKGMKNNFKFLDEQINMRRYADYAFACSRQAALWKFGSMEFKGKTVTIIHNAIISKKYAYNEKIRTAKRKN